MARGPHGGAVACAVPLHGQAEDIERLLRGDPFTWLPDPVLEHGVHEFRCTVRLLGTPVLVRCRLSGSWIRGDTVSRGVELDLGRTLVGTAVRHIRGHLALATATEGEAALSFEGKWTRPRAALLPGRAVARRLVLAFLHEIGTRLQRALTNG